MFILINKLTLFYLNFISRHKLPNLGKVGSKLIVMLNIANVKSPY